ncbi:ABC transporter substrate-binding protein [Bradyrhizobium sp. SRL28]|uniref:ABC transporter substrate-binding protein n=1 Tax=Bradyrhizobium sp. SRL28 TaxID=2836178 RepID=UPI001BDE9763|nr:ABC transporter substrate-binding protein [Bradyrhizobium sp. SRL28]MBT1516474.1 ABC transporter substrate-binding protein [Bradyrhizobium sp. SRL28]
MIKQNFGNRSSCGVSRRSLLHSAAALLSVPFVAKATAAWAQEKLAGSGEVVVFSNGGSLTEGARRYVFDPFTRATGIKVVDVVTDDSEPQVRAMFRAGRMDWDTAFVRAQNYPAMREAGMFEPIDYNLWDDESIQGVPSYARRKDAIVVMSTAMVLAYDQRAFPKGGPQNWVDFWNVKKFPGLRGLYPSHAKFNIVFALIADGVPHRDIWPLTDDKVDRAFRKLDEIKPHIAKWWIAGGEAPQLLINREYAISSAYDGRMIGAIGDGAPLKFVWDGAYLGDYWATILKGGPNTANAQKLYAFLNRAQIAAGWTQGTRSPGPNTNQLKYLPPDLASQVNVNPDNASKAVREDSVWIAEKRSDGKTNGDHLQERWLAWRAQ